MQKIGHVGLTLLLLLGIFFVVSPQKVDASGAVVIRAFECFLLDGNGNIVLADSSHEVQTSSNQDNTIQTCSAKKVPNSTGTAVFYDFANTGFFCGTSDNSRFTTDWRETVSASGNAKLVCHFKNS